MNIAENLTRIENAKSDIKTAIENKGVTVGDDKIDTYASKINEIETGGNIEDYFKIETTRYWPRLTYLIKKIPKIISTEATTMESMFMSCETLTSLDLSGLDTSNVTNMQSMFYDCRSLTSLDLSNFDTSKVTTIHSMFYDCRSLTSLDLSNFDTSKVTTIHRMFYYCDSLTSLTEIDCSKVKSTYETFQYCNKLMTFGGLKDLGYDYATSTTANYSFYELNLSYCTNLTHDSLMNVINKLYDIKTKGCNPQKLTLGSTNLAKLTAEEIAIATDKGWTVS